MCRHRVVPAALVLLIVCAPARAQQRNATDALRALSLDSLTGSVPVHYSEGHADRARRLQPRYAAVVASHEGRLSQDFDIGLAILDPEDWAALTGTPPYGMPHIDYSGWPHLYAVLPATSDEGALAEAARQRGVDDPAQSERFVDTIGLHEFGHGLVAQYVYRGAVGTNISIHEARPPLDFVTEWPNPEPGPGGHRTAAPAELEWSPCEFEPEELTFLDLSVDPTRLRCGHLSVPAHRGDPESPRFRLAFVVIAAENPDAGAPPIVYLHGGPGGSALTPYFLVLEGPALATDRDVIAFDQRGAGRSEPRLCGGLAGNDLDIAARDQTPAGEVASRRRFRRACLEELRDTGIDPGAFDMDATVADLEDLRQALGPDRWTVFGRSYGGALAQRAMREYPGTIDRAVLVTPAPLDWSNFDREVPAMAATLERVVRACAGDSECHAAFPEPEADLLEVFESLRERPWTVDVDPERLGSPTFTINATDFMWMVNERLYNAAQQIGYLPAILRALADRDSLVAAAVVQEAFGGWSDDAPLAAYGVYCRDIVDAGSRARSEEAGASYPRALRAIAGLHLEICEDWPVVPGSPEARRPVRSDIPTLLFSAGLDHVVPASTGAEIVRGLPNGHRVVFASSSHILPDSPESAECAFGIIRRFVRDPNAVDVTCAARLPPLEMSGALPDAMRRPR